jgi:hypothetical protein
MVLRLGWTVPGWSASFQRRQQPRPTCNTTNKGFFRGLMQNKFGYRASTQATVSYFAQTPNAQWRNLIMIKLKVGEHDRRNA